MQFSRCLRYFRWSCNHFTESSDYLFLRDCIKLGFWLDKDLKRHQNLIFSGIVYMYIPHKMIYLYNSGVCGVRFLHEVHREGCTCFPAITRSRGHHSYSGSTESWVAKWGGNPGTRYITVEIREDELCSVDVKFATSVQLSKLSQNLMRTCKICGFIILKIVTLVYNVLLIEFFSSPFLCRLRGIGAHKGSLCQSFFCLSVRPSVHVSVR